MPLLSGWRSLRRLGILGMNERNARYILPNNPRSHYPRVDDKLYSKRLALEAGLPVPDLLGVVEHHHQLKGLPHLLSKLESFVVKPARGAQGNGILVVVGRSQGKFLRSRGTQIDEDQIRHRVSSIISGVFSLRGDADTCVIEDLVRLHSAFEDLTWRGIPDLRIVVYRGVPVMAMCRLPTNLSDGRANLHQGAIGVGIDIATGRAVHAAHHNHVVMTHIDTGAKIIGFQVPMWDKVVELASRATDMIGLGYLGVDIVIDRTRGPLLLELNARPGLAIQLANNEGLLPRLRQVDAAADQLAKVDWKRRCEIANEWFSDSSS